MKIGEVVRYIGEYDNCHKYDYEIISVYKNIFGVNWWCDLKAVEPNIYTHYVEILSVKKADIEYNK